MGCRRGARDLGLKVTWKYEFVGHDLGHHSSALTGARLSGRAAGEAIALGSEDRSSSHKGSQNTAPNL